MSLDGKMILSCAAGLAGLGLSAAAMVARIVRNPAGKGKKSIILYRAADSDTITGPVAFAVDIEDARAYLDNRGFGGAILYQTEIDYEDGQVLDVRGSEANQIRSLVVASGCSDPGAMTADAYVMQDHVAAALVERGYRWVRILDTYPIGAETWVYLYDGEDPEMIEVA